MSEAGAVRLATRAMGCRFELVLSGAPDLFLLSAGEEAIELIEEAHARLTRFEPGSVVSRLNAGSEERLDAELFGLFETCEDVRTASDGAFDITRGGALALDADRRTVRVLRGDIDMGGIGKGFAVDLAAASLRESGVPGGFVHAGTSTCRGFGDAEGSPWSVRIGSDTTPPPFSIDVSDRALSVSGDEIQGAHIIDPRTDSPVEGTVFGACTGPSAVLCDAWSTALAVTGSRPDRMPSGYASIMIRDNEWHAEPSGLRVLEEAVR